MAAVLHGFELLEEQEIRELNTRARLFRHVRTGAELLSMENEDENKVFGITFRTPPTDSTGLPHILEHSVLCGSRKYPLKEPFVELLKGSLQTFLNAFTYPDRTCYPVASQNLQDFYNLVDVYLDAVFHPRITPQILWQEGWHYELEDPEAALIYKGVVFNEMKGANASPERVLSQAVQSSLFPDSPYGVDSGGDPEVIPDLTYEQFKNFHERYYHPSNARIFFYGNDDPEERLRLIDEALAEFDRLEVESEIPLQERFVGPKRVEEVYPVSPDEDTSRRGMVTVNWLLSEGIDWESVLAMGILEYILVGRPASPLRRTLIESGLGEDLAGGGLSDELRQMYFSTGLKGVDVANADRIENLILDTLARLAQEGIDPELVEAGLNTIEFRLRENNTGTYPRGLILMLRSLTTWLYEGDPLAPLAFEEPLERIKERAASGERFFEEMIERHFLANPHRTTVVLKPDPELAAQREARERERLETVRKSMSEEEVQRVIEETRTLKEIQATPDSPEALATIPRLSLKDLERENKVIPCEVLEEAGVPVLYHDLFTSNILYFDLGMDLHTLPPELLPYAPLFGRALLEMGTRDEDFAQLSQRIDRETGGIRPSLLTTSVTGSKQGAAWLFLRGKAMVSQVDDLFAILRDVLLGLNLDNRDRFREILLEEKAGLEASLTYNGHRVVNRRLRSHFDEAGWASEQMEGISQLFFLRDLATQIEADWSSVLTRLEEVRQTLVRRGAMLGNVTLDRDNWQSVEARLGAFLAALPEDEAVVQAWDVPEGTPGEGLTIPAQVNYVGKATPLYEMGYELDGSALVVSRYLRTSWLWNQVRVQGGAYGAFAAFEPRSGIFSFLSYRDPNLLDTLAVYNRTPEYLRELELSDDELTKAIIGAIGDMDTYQLPDARGYTSLERYLAGVTDAERQRLREEILTTQPSDFKAFADVVEKVAETGHVVVMGASTALENAQQALEIPFPITKVL